MAAVLVGGDHGGRHELILDGKLPQIIQNKENGNHTWKCCWLVDTILASGLVDGDLGGRND